MIPSQVDRGEARIADFSLIISDIIADNKRNELVPGTLSEKLYYKLPVSLQNSIFTIYGWNTSRKRYNHFFDEHLERLKRMQWWSAEKIKAYQNEQVKRIVRHAYDTTHFYRHWYDKHGVDISSIKSTSDLKRLPILTKDIVKNNYHEMISSSFDKHLLLKSLTSGTTGTPLTIYQTSEGLAYQWAVWWRHKSRFGLTLNDCHLTFGARVPVDQNQSHPPYWRHDFLNNRVYMSTYHLSKRTVHDIVAYLNSTYFDFFTGYPSAMYVLATLIEESGLRVYNCPKYIVTGADALLPNYEAVITRVFGAPVTEQYGMTEFAGNMSKCEHGNFHLDFECCYVETLPQNDSDFESLIMTGWGNLAMPFIRYQVGDYGLPMDQLCTCGRMSQGFTSIGGRLEDYVITPDGRKLIGMNQVFEYAKNAKEMQIYQKTCDEIEFRIVPKDGFGQEDKEALVREFRRRGGDEMHIAFAIVDKLEHSSSGKLKAVISEVSE